MSYNYPKTVIQLGGMVTHFKVKNLAHFFRNIHLGRLKIIFTYVLQWLTVSLLYLHEK
jgi:hypothetical protein